MGCLFVLVLAGVSAAMISFFGYPLWVMAAVPLESRSHPQVARRQSADLFGGCLRCLGILARRDRQPTGVIINT